MPVDHPKQPDDLTATRRLTQFCPNCEYDLHGLPEDRCPECGTQFDRSRLPLVERREPRSNPLANLVLLGALLLALIHYSLGRGPPNVALQTLWVSVMWAFAGLWLWLRRSDVFERNRQHWLLWLLVPCVFTAGKITEPAPLSLAATICSALAAIMVLACAFGLQARNALRILLYTVSAFSGICGALLMVAGTACFVGGVESGAVYYILTWELPAAGANHLYAAAYGLALLGIGLLALMLARRVSKSMRRSVT